MWDNNVSVAPDGSGPSHLDFSRQFALLGAILSSRIARLDEKSQVLPSFFGSDEQKDFHMMEKIKLINLRKQLTTEGLRKVPEITEPLKLNTKEKVLL